METINTILQTVSDSAGKERMDRKDGMELAMAYVPMQKWEDIYESDMLLKRWTIFRQLDKPFKGKETD